MNEHQIIKDFIRKKKGYTTDAIKIVRMIKVEWELSFDWHLASYALDSLRESDEVRVVGHNRDGMTEYFVEFPELVRR